MVAESTNATFDEPLVVATHLTRRFGDRVAIHSFSLTVHRGEIIALLGPNGAGKTTTLRMLSGVLSPTSGTITIAGQALTSGSSDHLRARIGLLTESPGLWERLTLEANLLTYARLYGLRQPTQAVDTALARFDLTNRRHSKAGELSKGMKQKAALARALMHEPDVLLLDEPTAGLDPEMTRGVRDLVLDERRRGRAIVLSTHNLDEAERVADRVAIVNGQLIEIATPAALSRQLDSRVRFGLAEAAEPFARVLAAHGGSDISVEGTALVCTVANPSRDTPSLVRALVEAGANIVSVTQERTPLEAAYLALVNGVGPTLQRD